MKKITAFILALMLLLSFSACTTDTQPEDASNTAERTAEEWITFISEKVPFDDTMTSVGPEQAKAVYGIFEEDGYNGDCALYISTMATPEEVAVFKADSNLSLDDIRKKMEDRLSTQIESYSDYAPTEVPKLESAVIKIVGDTVILAVTADNALADEIIK